MHFWIDKRSQCAYSGRHRVPSSLSAGVGRSRGRVCVGTGAGGRKGMAAPVHRFAAVDCPPRRPHRTHRHYGPPPMSSVQSARRVAAEETRLYVEVPPSPPQPTIASLAAARSVTPDTLLRTAALGLHHAPVMAPHLKFGMMVSFTLAAAFLAGAKYYFDRQVVRDNNAGGEAGVVCAAVACVCGVGCALSLCRSKPPPAAPPDRVSSTAMRDVRPPSSDPSDDISLVTVTTERAPTQPAATSSRASAASGASTAASIASEAPPPYNIAVLMPTRASPPPPAYSALS